MTPTLREAVERVEAELAFTDEQEKRYGNVAARVELTSAEARLIVSLVKAVIEPGGVEKVARAICRAYSELHFPHPRNPEAIDCQVENGWELWTNEAKAALQAIVRDDG